MKEIRKALVRMRRACFGQVNVRKISRSRRDDNSSSVRSRTDTTGSSIRMQSTYGNRQSTLIYQTKELMKENGADVILLIFINYSELSLDGTPSGPYKSVLSTECPALWVTFCMIKTIWVQKYVSCVQSVPSTMTATFTFLHRVSIFDICEVDL
uniref:Uncharacterized protein n=1 Tax=Strigamia maritima TaxID=126957 RepID=T1IW62_STRMM